jgi:ATP-dependent RNA helicase DDX27
MTMPWCSFPQDVESLGSVSLRNPALLASDDYQDSPHALTEEVVRLKPHQETDREAVLMALCQKVCPHRALVFFPAKHVAHHAKVAAGLLGMSAGELHGNLSQAQRLEALEAFRSGKVDLLFATDVAARGIDVPAVRTVLSYEPPPTLDAYVHRIGRTARAGAAGRAITIAEKGDRKLIKQISKRNPGHVKDRKLPDEAIAKWRKALEGVQSEIEKVLQQEREEKEARKAAMEATKAEHLSEHAEEIASRPKRTWFQSEKQKQARARQASDAAKAKAIAGQPARCQTAATKPHKRKRDAAPARARVQKRKAQSKHE